MDKFEEAWKANRHVWESTKNLAKAMYLAGEAAQQAKVEELQVQRKGAEERSLLILQYKDKYREERDELQKQLIDQGQRFNEQAQLVKDLEHKKGGLQKRVDYLERQISIKTRHCEFFERSRMGHRSLAIKRKLQIEKAANQIEALYAKAEKDYEKDRNPYYDGMLSALDLAEQAIRGELGEQALKGEAE